VLTGGNIVPCFCVLLYCTVNCTFLLPHVVGWSIAGVAFYCWISLANILGNIELFVRVRARVVMCIGSAVLWFLGYVP
jgi:hypothetical protein